MVLDVRDESPWTPAAWAGFGLACAVLTLVFNGSWLFSDRVGILDWPKELYYFHYLRASLLEYWQLPVSFFTIPESLRHFSTLQDLSYWSNPEVVSLSPFLPLLWLMPLVWFIKTYFILHYVIGIAGTGLLAKRLGLPPAEGVALFALIVLNPWLAQHLAIGYSPYINYLLFPAVAALLLAPPRSPLQTALAALGCAMAFYQGALHLFVWFNLGALAVAALACVHRRSPWPLARVMWMQVLTFVLVFPKYRAVTWAYADFIRSPGTGYSSRTDLWGLITDTQSPLFDFPATYTRYGVAFYDASLGVGAWFTALLGLAVLCWPLLGREKEKDSFPCWIPAACCALFLALGWGGNWLSVTRLVPALASEIYPFRWLYPAYLFAAVFTLAVLVRAASGIRARAAVFVLLLPCLWVFHQRNAVFSEVMNREEDIFEGFSMREHLTHKVTALSGNTLLPRTANPDGLIIIPPGSEGDPVHLPWLSPWRLREYEFTNMRPDVFQPGTTSVMVVTAGTRPVAVKGRTHARGVLGAACAAVFIVMAWSSCRMRGSRHASGRHLQ